MKHHSSLKKSVNRSGDLPLELKQVSNFSGPIQNVLPEIAQENCQNAL